MSDIVTIIGMGPRGLSILERIISIAQGHSSTAAIEIHVVDTKECGQGVHSAQQPQYLLTNTLACQVTLFPEEHTHYLSSNNFGPSFTEWANKAGYRWFKDGYYKTAGKIGKKIDEYDYLPRCLLGEYLMWFYEKITQSLPSNIKIIHHRNFAIDMQPTHHGQYLIELDNKSTITSDYIFMTTGHGERIKNEQDQYFYLFVDRHSRYNRNLAYFNGAYPTDKFKKIRSDAVVAIQGFGLTAHDVVAELTIGRSGKFSNTGKHVKYKKSGREPKIIIFSRNCLPFSARGVNQKGISGQRKTLFLTKQAILELQAKATRIRGNKQLDFEIEILPLLFKEMAYVYHTTQYGKPINPDQYQMSGEERAIIESLFYPIRGKSFAKPADFKKFFIHYMQKDLYHANLGNINSPVKAATDVIREVREALRTAIEYGGLTPESHQKFINYYAPIMNCIAFGPPKHRSSEWLALMNEGIIDIASAPNPKITIDQQSAKFVMENSFPAGIEKKFADVLIIAKIDTFYPETDSSIFMHNLLKRGLIKPYYNGAFHPGGIDIDKNFHPITRNNTPLQNIWAVGYLVEGPHYFTHALPRPFMNSRPIQDADQCVVEMFNQIVTKQRQTEAAFI